LCIDLLVAALTMVDGAVVAALVEATDCLRALPMMRYIENIELNR
jgi:hypothetical protein